MKDASLFHFDPQQAQPVAWCCRCKREVYSPFDGLRLPGRQLCGDCLEQLMREVGS